MFDFLRNLTKSAEERRREAVTAYLDNALSSRERQRFEQELAQDQALQTQLEAERRLKEQLRALPRRRVPRNFTLDPALYGRPQRQPLLQLYPALRVATALNAIFLIAVLVAGAYTYGAPGMPSFDAAQVSQTTAEEAPAAEEPMESFAVEGEVVEVTQVVADEAMTEAAEGSVEETAAEPIPELEIPGEEAAGSPPVVAATFAPTPEPTATPSNDAEEIAPSVTQNTAAATEMPAAGEGAEDGTTSISAQPTTIPVGTAVAQYDAATLNPAPLQPSMVILPTATISTVPRPEATDLLDGAAREITSSVAGFSGVTTTLHYSLTNETVEATSPSASPISNLPVILGVTFVILLAATLFVRRRIL